jgi:putative MATE family efflux protein
MISYLGKMFYALVDLYWIGQLGADATAALSGCTFIYLFCYSVADLASIGTVTLVAQNIGAGKIYRARLSSGQGIALQIGLTLFMILAGLVGGKSIIALLGLNAVGSALAEDYFKPLLVGLPFILLFDLLQRIMYGLGDTKTPMFLLFFSYAVTMALDPILILGMGGFFPALGIAGASWALTVSSIVCVALSFMVLYRKHCFPTVFKKGGNEFCFDSIGVISKIGAPIAFNGITFSVIYIVLVRIISRFGSDAVAALGICHRIENTGFFASFGFFIALTTLVGQYLGAGLKEKARHAAIVLNVYSMTAIFMFSLIYFLFSSELVQIFSQDPEVLQIGISYLRIIALTEVFLSLEGLMGGVYIGAGNTLTSMLVILPLTALRIPFAWFFSVYLNLGIASVWWTISISTVFKGCLLSYLFFQGKWKEVAVIDRVRDED